MRRGRADVLELGESEAQVAQFSWRGELRVG